MGALEVLKVLTTISALCVSLSPAASMYRRYKAQDTGHFQIVPLLGMASNYTLLGLYGLFIDDIFPLAITSFMCASIGLTYVITFVLCTRDRPSALKKCAVFAVPMALFVLYAILAATGATSQSHANTGKVYGYITIATTAIFYTSPLLKIKHVLQTKSAAVLPIALCCVGTTNNALWLSYGATINNWIIAGPNTFCCFFGIFQICLWIKYRPTRIAKEGAETADDVRISIEISAANDKHLESSLESPTFHSIASPMAPVGLKPELVDGQRV